MVLLGLDYAPSFIKKIAFSIIDKNLSPTFPIHTKNTDIRCMKDLRASIDLDSVIVNLAAEYRDDVMPKSLYGDVNVQGARNICTIANERGLSKIIFTSSVAVYGFVPLGTNEGGDCAV